MAPTQLLHRGSDLRHMVHRVVPPAHNHMYMVVPTTLCCNDPLLEDLLRLFDVQPMKVYCVPRLVRVVGTEDEVARLRIVVVHLHAMTLPFLAECVGCGSIPGLVGCAGALETAAALLRFLACDWGWWVLVGVDTGCGKGGFVRPRRRSYSASSASVAPPWWELPAVGMVGLVLSDLTRVNKCEPCGLSWFIRNDIVLIWKAPAGKAGKAVVYTASVSQKRSKQAAALSRASPGFLRSSA